MLSSCFLLLSLANCAETFECLKGGDFLAPELVSKTCFTLARTLRVWWINQLEKCTCPECRCRLSLELSCLIIRTDSRFSRRLSLLPRANRCVLTSTFTRQPINCADRRRRDWLDESFVSTRLRHSHNLERHSMSRSTADAMQFADGFMRILILFIHQAPS